jgi:hypothetical protein
MSLTRTHWRLLLTVFLTATLAVFSVLGAGHAYAGSRHATHAHRVSAGHPEAPGPDRAFDVSDRAERADDDAPASPCGLNCCCQASLARWEPLAPAVGWKPGRLLAGIREVAFDSLSPETPPEPPRTFA